MKIDHVIIDGSNIATEGRDAPSLAQLDEAVQAFIEEYSPKHVTVVVDATFPNRIDRKERQTYEDAVNANELITPPAGAIGRGDAFVLQIAKRAGASILSNDSFQEFHGEYPWLFDRGRLIGGKPVPHVGWVFMERAPVRGPTSRRAVSEARKVAKAVAHSPAPDGEAEAPAEALEPAVADAPAPARPRRSRAKKAAAAPAVAEAVETAEETPAEDVAAGDGARGGRAVEPYNDALPFIDFVGRHAVGSEVEATVERFSSHGAYVAVGDARAYVPLRNLGDPAPRSAKEVLRLGEPVRLIVVAIDPPRRGIDLAVPGVIEVPTAAPPAPEAVAEPAPPAKKAPAKRAAAKAPATKAAAKKAPAKKAPAAKKAAAKAPAKKAATARKTAAKAPAAKATAAKKSTARKAPARKAAAPATGGSEPPAEPPAGGGPAGDGAAPPAAAADDVVVPLAAGGSRRRRGRAADADERRSG